MRNLFLFTAMMVSTMLLGGCTVVVHDAPRRVYTQTRARTYCGTCNGYRCGHSIYRSYQRTVVVERRHTSHHSHRRYAPTRTRTTRYVPVAPAAPRQVRRSYGQSSRQVSRSKTTYQSSRTRREASRSRSSVRQAPSRQTVSRARSAGSDRDRTAKRVKRRRARQ